MLEIDLHDTLRSRHASKKSKIALRDVSLNLMRSKKVVVVTGAGVSTSAGIPDFRSSNGLYATKGSNLFSSHVFKAEDTMVDFHKMVSTLHNACTNASPTPTHHFLAKLASKNRLLRSYTQNVDGMEARAGLKSSAVSSGFHKKETKVVELHGNIGQARCRMCLVQLEMRSEWVGVFGKGEAPNCPVCEERALCRAARNARSTSIGTLRPAIVLYDEDHPSGWEIGSLVQHDLDSSPDLLLILGTSLKVHGLKNLVKDFIKEIHSTPPSSSATSSKKAIKKRGMVVFVNKTPPGKEWEKLIDVFVQGETDMWVGKAERDWRKERPGDWETQTVLDVSELKAAASVRKTHKHKPSSSISRIPLQPIAPSSDNDAEPTVLLSPSSPKSSPKSPAKPKKRKRAVEDLSEDSLDEIVVTSRKDTEVKAGVGGKVVKSRARLLEGKRRS